MVRIQADTRITEKMLFFLIFFLESARFLPNLIDENAALYCDRSRMTTKGAGDEPWSLQHSRIRTHCAIRQVANSNSVPTMLPVIHPDLPR